MSCRMYRDMMMEYFDDNMNDVEFAQLKQHMKACKSCKDEFHELDIILGTIEEDTAAEPPLNFEEQVMAKIKSLDSERNRNIAALIYGIPILIFISLPVILLLKFSGSRILDMIIKAFEYLLPFSGEADMISNIITALGIITSRIKESMFQISVGLMISYYDIFITLVAVLFAVEWMFITLVRKSWRKA